MATSRFYVPGISCHHCVNAVMKEVSALAGVQNVHVVLDDTSVTVEHASDMTVDMIVAAINEAGYDEVTIVS